MPTTSPIDDVLTVERPWGSFDVLLSNAPATVKVITVAAGQRLSLQRHQSRDEMWQVLDGRVDVEVDGQRSRPGPGQRVWVRRGATHRLGNSSDQPIHVLEVAFGDFDEDDIERLEDDYQRAPARAI
jgi:mannose-1-phosphate guanylyltransferase/mannose-6-phosphate isomerase